MTKLKKNILVTGAEGFIGKNLILCLSSLEDVVVSKFLRGNDLSRLQILIEKADVVVHLAGENRPENEHSFEDVNSKLTYDICQLIKDRHLQTGKYLPILLTSSIQAKTNTAYGRSKRLAEEAIQKLHSDTSNPCSIFRLPGVFGKWCKPNYNSVVATFCHNIAHGLPINIHDPERNINLVYVDDVVQSLINTIDDCKSGCNWVTIRPEYKITLGALADRLYDFNISRKSLFVSRVSGFMRALYSTFISYLPEADFSYDIVSHADTRGVFVEFIKTKDSGQISYFTANPGVTRDHYHNTKQKSFLFERRSFI